MGSIANELITRGWTQGQYEAEDGSVCLYGAILKATNETEWELECVADSESVRVGGIVHDLLKTGISGWNDAPERTYDDVLRLAKQADEVLGL